MSNMSYCRFTNTVSDMEDCIEHIYRLAGEIVFNHANAENIEELIDWAESQPVEGE